MSRPLQGGALLAYLMLLALWSGAAAAQAAEKAVDVIVAPVVQKVIERRLEALGTLRANESVRLTSNITKPISKINFEDGQRVKQGDVLVEMSSTEERALLSEIRFTVDEAKKQLDRVKPLVASNAAPASLLDQQVREYEGARARYLALEARLNLLHIDAPFSGVVGLRNISVGALVSPGDLITTLNDDSRMKLDFSVPSVYLASLRIGLPVVASSPALGDAGFSGEIVSIDNQINPATRAIMVRAVLPNQERRLKQGLLMTVELYADSRETLVIPESALVPLGSNNFVFVVTAGKDNQTTVERRQVYIGQRLQGEVEVISGLSMGDRVVTHGVQKISAGTVVNPRGS
jgi:membrane fusion protein (multidrug efflux system)